MSLVNFDSLDALCIRAVFIWGIFGFRKSLFIFACRYLQGKRMEELADERRVDWNDKMVMKRLFDRFYAPLRSFAYKHVGDDSITEDFVQTAFLNLWERREGFKIVSAIKNFLKSEGRNVNPETIYNYISYLEKSFVIYRCQRFDLQGKALLKTQEKYFLSDPSLKYALMGFSPRSIAAMMENVLYLEMRRRGYEVYVGKLGNKEIDFVGIKDGKRIYIQLAREKPSFSNRESDNLKAIQDNYRKYIVTMDRMYVGDDEGIDVVYLPEFLLRKEW